MSNQEYLNRMCGNCAWWSTELSSLPDPTTAYIGVCRKTGIPADEDSSACPDFVDNDPERRNP